MLLSIIILDEDKAETSSSFLYFIAFHDELHDKNKTTKSDESGFVWHSV